MQEKLLKVIMVGIIVQIDNIVKALNSMSLINTMSMVYGNGIYNAVVLKHKSDRSKGTENEQHTLDIQKDLTLYVFLKY